MDRSPQPDNLTETAEVLTIEVRPEDGEGDPQSPGNTDAPRRPKRQKIANACESCRTRKIKCDGTRPVCGPCRQRKQRQHVTCVYTKDAPRDATDLHMTTQSLIDRIHSLERVIASSHRPEVSQEHSQYAQHNRTSTRSGSQAPDELLSSPHINQRDVQHLSGNPLESVPITSLPVATPNVEFPNVAARAAVSNGTPKTLGSPENETSPVNAMGSTTSAAHLNTTNEFYGGSSAAHFMQQLKEVVPSSGAILPPGPTFVPYQTRQEDIINYDGLSFPPGKFILPIRDLADTLLDTYWTRSHTLYPFIHKSTFMRAYEELWKPSSQVHRGMQRGDFGLGTSGVSDSRTIIFHCALNAIFALSCQLSEDYVPRRDRGSLSESFFLRSKSLLHVDILDHGSIALVQTLLIIAQFLQSTSYPSRCWTSLGLACRIGQGLGLHVEDRTTVGVSSHEVEIRRRVWYGCTIMDIVASTTLGRPPMTPCQVTIPLPSTCMEGELLDANQLISQSAFYLETIKLYLILGRIISALYMPWSLQGASHGHEGKNKNTTQSTESEAVMTFDEDLSNFEDEITSYLHWERGKAIRGPIPQPIQLLLDRQTNVLHARYLHTKVLLYRPIFLRFCRRMRLIQQSLHPNHNVQNVDADYQFSKERNLRSKMDLQLSATCVSAAVDLINLLSYATTTTTDGAWWYTSFYLCTSAMVLMLAESCFKSHQDLQFDIGEMQKALDLCWETMRNLIKRGHPVEPTLNGLDKIHRELIPETAIQRQSNYQEAASGMSGLQEIGLRRDAQNGESVSFTQGLYLENVDSAASASNVSHDTFVPPMQPVMDFIMQDVNFMPFGVLDESWWRLQYGDTNNM